MHIYLVFLAFLVVVPHITDAIQEWVERVASQPVDKSGCYADVCLIEVCMNVVDADLSVTVTLYIFFFHCLH